MPIPLKGLKLKRLYLAPAKRPDKRSEAAYLAAWYQIKQQGLRRPRNPNAVARVTARVPVADDLSIPDFLKREPESPDGILEAAE